MFLKNKGCDYCNCSKDFMLSPYKRVVINNIKHTIQCINTEENGSHKDLTFEFMINYCPKCGRKL